MENPIPRYPIPNLDIPLPPPPTMTLQHQQLQVTSPVVQLQPAPQSRIIQLSQSQQIVPPQTRPPQNSRPQRPRDKSQEEWLRESGHGDLQSFMDYYGFDMTDHEDFNMGQAFLGQIRKQEQEVWEQTQGQILLQQAQRRSQPVNRAYAANPISRPASNSSNSSTHMTRQSEDPMINRYHTGSYLPQQQQLNMNASPYQSQYQQRQASPMKHLQMQGQIPRSSTVEEQIWPNRFHTATVNRAFSEDVLSVYGFKP